MNMERIESKFSELDISESEPPTPDNFEIMPGKVKYPNAYIWLLMKGDKYLPGIMASMYSVAATNPKADLVAMLTPDISNDIRQILMKVATHIVVVPYLKFNSNLKRMTKKQRSMYDSWMDVSYTKWNCLALTAWKKIMFLDADIIVLENIDHLFSLQAPAGPWSNPFAKPVGYIKNWLHRGKYQKHGGKVFPRTVDNILHKSGITLSASTVLLEPSIESYSRYLTMMANLTKDKPYGNDCFSGYDEQSIAEFYSSRNITWTNIHHRYNYIGWKDGFLSKKDYPRVIHYFSSDKPWMMKYNEWPDVLTWYLFASCMLIFTGLDASSVGIDIKQLTLAENQFIKNKNRDPYWRKWKKLNAFVLKKNKSN